ncbi:MAG: nucleotidyl transferase AbiEii/AbiGii toxin family protein [Candidatus Auribacterota bacterium]|nr:nucleotidyl transferase AbiEii/AbiGii toxin family protein [Candidatus Auribacterota bacterium]
MNDLNDILGSPELFREYINYTARQVGFRRELVEKDFFCSVILSYLAKQLPDSVVFKGGTSLSKIYTEFYRLSEDLDFALSLFTGTSRGDRRQLIKPVKEICAGLSKTLPGILGLESLHGANESRQYIGAWGYLSIVSGEVERIKLEFSLREELLFPGEILPARTLLLNAITGSDAISPFGIRVMVLPEIWAEKVRAALTRPNPAIRDFFDLDYAVLEKYLNLEDGRLLDLVRKKLVVPRQGPVDYTAEKLENLKRQIKTRLRPVLRDHEFNLFNLERIWGFLTRLADKL